MWTAALLENLFRGVLLCIPYFSHLEYHESGRSVPQFLQC